MNDDAPECEWCEGKATSLYVRPPDPEFGEEGWKTCLTCDRHRLGPAMAKSWEERPLEEIFAREVMEG